MIKPISLGRMLKFFFCPYYEIHGKGEPVVVLHVAFMAISGDWNAWVAELSKTRKVIAVEMQGHGRTADIQRDLSYENLADDVAGCSDFSRSFATLRVRR